MRLFLLAILLAPPIARATPVDDERITNGYQRAILGGDRLLLDPALLGPERTKLAIDAIENLVTAGRALDLPSLLPAYRSLAPQQQARWFRLGGMSEADLAASLATAAPAMWGTGPAI